MSNPVLVRCSYPEVEYRSGKIVNPVINLSNVFNIQKGYYAWYPDNVGLPSIEFYLNEKEFVRWVFPQETAQMAEQDKITGRYSMAIKLNTKKRDDELDLIFEKFK